MGKKTKIAFYILLTLSACFFTWRFRSNYTRLMAGGEPVADSDLINVKLPDYQKNAAPTRTDYHLGAWGAALVLSLIGLGLIVAHDLSSFFGGRALKVLYNEEGEGIANPDYENAEEQWAKGNFIESIQLMRDCLKHNPREQHIAMRIGEIYEEVLSEQGKGRSEEQRKRDPISQLAMKLKDEGVLDQAGLDAMDAEIRAEVDEAVRFADESPDPDPAELTTHVLAD